MEDWKPCSRILSHILDYMGYCKWIINARKNYYGEVGRYFTQQLFQDESGPRSQALISGSKGEGLSNLLQSDTDVLAFLDYICGTFEPVNDAKYAQAEDPTRYMLKVKREWSPPGYCILVLGSRPTQPVRFDMIENSLSIIDKGVICLSGAKLLPFVAEVVPSNTMKAQPLSGPSQPATYKGLLDHDIVVTLSCPCSNELDAWYKRPRHHDWPSKSLQNDVISTPANVVPIGSKGDKFGQLEWRFCFNNAELKLMHSLNHTQTKVYVSLKMILKDYLKPEKKEITSYVMKNIVFWMCETNPSTLFTPSTLLSWIYVGLETLKNHIETGNVPYYMIPSRNLLQGKFSDDDKKSAFLDKLSKLLESGVCLVHVCEAIKLGLELYNAGQLEDFGWKRNAVEIYSFPVTWLPNKMKATREFLRLAGIDRPVTSILFPDLLNLIAQGCTRDDVVKLRHYRESLFLNHEKADIVTQNAEY